MVGLKPPKLTSPMFQALVVASVALARKLAVVLHKMWTAGEDYRLKAVA